MYLPMIEAPEAVPKSNGMKSMYSTLSELRPPAEGPAPAGAMVAAIRPAASRAKSFFTREPPRIDFDYPRGSPEGPPLLPQALGLGPGPFRGPGPLIDVQDHLSKAHPMGGHLDALVFTDEFEGLLERQLL